MTFTQTSGNVYSVADYKAKNVGDFIQEAIDIGPCGDFTIKQSPPIMAVKIRKWKPQEAVEMTFGATYNFNSGFERLVPMHLAGWPIEKVIAIDRYGVFKDFEIYV